MNAVPITIGHGTGAFAPSMAAAPFGWNIERLQDGFKDSPMRHPMD